MEKLAFLFSDSRRMSICMDGNGYLRRWWETLKKYNRPVTSFLPLLFCWDLPSCEELQSLACLVRKFKWEAFISVICGTNGRLYGANSDLFLSTKSHTHAKASNVIYNAFLIIVPCTLLDPDLHSSAFMDLGLTVS